MSMDLIVKLPTTADGHDTILMFVDSRLKAEQDGAFGAHYRVLNARSFAALFVNIVVRLQGLPATLI